VKPAADVADAICRLELDTTRDDAGRRLIAVLASLLGRYTDRSTLVIGYLPDAAETPVAVDLSVGDDPTFGDLLERVSLALDRPRSAEASAELPAVDAVVALESDPPSGTSHPLWLTVRRAGDASRLVLHPNGSAGAGGSPQRLLGHLETLLNAATAAPSEPLGSLPVLTEQERHQLLVEWNDTAEPYPNRCVHELIREQAGLNPEKIGVSCGETELSYRELEDRASRLANHLATLGVGPEVLVGICLTRSTDMVVGLLGILKAGGAYVPIDPTYPAERQSFMLQSSQAQVLVTQESLLESLPVQGLTAVCLDRDWPAIARRSAEPPSIEVDREQLAYVIYTSGSTGQPKGVQIPHRALANFLTTMRQRPGLAAEDVLVAVTTLSFDIAGLELYLPLITGARLVIAESDTVGDPRALARLLEQSAATLMQATPTTWRMLLDSGWRGWPGLKALCGGEALPVALADSLVSAELELWNMYGPTETTIWSTVEHVTTQGQSLTIGRPIANTTLYILDSRMYPVPIGVPGELWIGGDGLARGYRGRDDLTAERFVPHPFDDRAGARIYRTGDLARYRNDGRVEYLGRIDHQVKVRGFRIELGEIETVLTRHPAVASAVVVARGGAADAELAAYVIPHGIPVEGHALRRLLTQKLPGYMVPSTVTVLESFPLTPNGKVDRKALPEPSRERSADHELVAPRTKLERRLADIWERDLGIQPIGVTDNFFDLGVTSIVAATLFAAIEHELGGSLPLGAIFRAPTIESLATLIEQGKANASRWTSLVPIQPEGSQPPIFCMHGGAGTILHLAPLARRLGPDQPFYGLQSRGLYGGAPPLRTAEEMASHYLSEMRQVHPEGPWYLAGYCFGTIVAFEIAQQLVAAGEEVRLLAMFNGPSPSWIKRWGWYGNQPSWKVRHSPSKALQAPAEDQARVASFSERLRRAIQQPRRFVSATKWYLRRPLTRLALATGRPVPEALREEFFLELHAKAERAYEPSQYPGGVLVFYGEGLYEDPSLGWEEYAGGAIRTYAVPGEHDNNRQAMMEPAVAFVGDRLQEHLSRGDPANLAGNGDRP
jgi:amino acid adenylation domain-containing protein